MKLSDIVGVSAVTVIAILSACGPGETGSSALSQVAVESSTSPSPNSSATTNVPPTTDPSTTVPPATEPPATEPSSTSTSTSVDSDPVLLAQQAALTALGYWLGEEDGVMGSMTTHAVIAFQKAEGLDRSGELDAATTGRLAVATRPDTRTTTGPMLEIDLQRQILIVVSSGRAEWTFDVATGSSATPTPPGEFTIYNQIDGFRHAPLGTLYRPKYFNGGIAIHGYTSVPSQPASHGCVRLTYSAMDFVWTATLAPLGSTVLVY